MFAQEQQTLEINAAGGLVDESRAKHALSGTMGANYRNYSILSQVIRNKSNPGRAIDASLK